MAKRNTPASARKALDVELLLRWAYRDELPKRQGGGLVSVSSSWEDYGERIDNWSREPGFPVALGPPHPDSIVIEHAVNRLPKVAPDWAASRRRLLPECADLLDDDDYVLRHMVVDPRPLVAMHARMGTRPPWEAGPMSCARVQAGNGRAKVIGRTDSRHYADAARCPLDWTPEPRGLASDRAEYAIWHGALCALAADLMLSSWIALPPATSASPWLVPDPPVTILPDLVVVGDAPRQRPPRWRRSIRALDNALGT